MIDTNKILTVSFSAVIATFEKLTGWSSAHQGIWNANKNAPVIFMAEYRARC